MSPPPPALPEVLILRISRLEPGMPSIVIRRAGASSQLSSHSPSLA